VDISFFTGELRALTWLTKEQASFFASTVEGFSMELSSLPPAFDAYARVCTVSKSQRLDILLRLRITGIQTHRHVHTQHA
jgi:hypothetical protein